MTRRWLVPLALLSLPALLTACSGDNGGTPPPDAGGAAGSGMDASPASDAAPAADAGAARGPMGIAVVNSDYKSTSISLLNGQTGAVTKDACITSGTRAPQLVATLSGDVVLPSQAQPGNAIVAIDRMNSTLTWLDPSCNVVRQMNVGNGFPANPQDVAGISASKAYVTRAGANPMKTDEGNDILIIDPSMGRATGRIDLAPHATPSTSGKAILAAAGDAVVLGDRVYVVLTNMSADFKAAGTGRVLIIDPATDMVTGKFDLPLRNCAGLYAVQSPRALVVSCGGLFGDPNRLPESGVVWIDLAAMPPSTKTVDGPKLGRSPSPFDAVALSSSQGFAVVPGEFGGMPPDQLWRLDFGASSATKAVDGSDAFTFGALLLDPAAKRLFLADGDAKTPRVRVFDVSGAAPSMTAAMPTGASGLPPRALSFY